MAKFTINVKVRAQHAGSLQIMAAEDVNFYVLSTDPHANLRVEITTPHQYKYEDIKKALMLWGYEFAEQTCPGHTIWETSLTEAGFYE